MSEVFVRSRSDRWGRYALYDAKIGSHPSAVILVKRTRRFRVGQRIYFANIDDCRGMSKSCTPAWKSAMVWKIEDDRLFLEL